MHNYFQHALLFLKRFAWLLLLYTLCRLFFYLLNTAYFKGIGFQELIWVFIAGIRFDIAAIIFTNAIFLFMIFPGTYKNKPFVQKTGIIIFIFINGMALLSNFIDARFFDFINKRSTSSIFTLLGTNKDVWLMIPRFIIDYWYVALLWAVLIFAFWYFMPVLKYGALVNEKMTFKNLSLQLVILCGITALMLLGARGTGLKPISMVDAANYTSLKNVPLVLNTPFSILKTIENENLQEKHYLPDDSLNVYYTPMYYPESREPARRMNIVILIMESFSREYSGYISGGESYTPCLDSLLAKSLVFTNAFANGTQSYEALPAILAGIPSLMDRPYSGSNYADNVIESLPGLLRKEGYITYFFHGGNNGTMGFNNFSRIAGVEYYMGRTEYNNDKDYDGNWGIWDEPYLQYFAEEMNTLKEPFFTSIFTLSSHHPYAIPAKYKNLFTEGQLPIHKSVRYADYALGKFFHSASKMTWFQNTLFIITADHAAQAVGKEFNSTTGMFAIPLACYCPSDTTMKGIVSTVCQQIDIMPTVLDYLNYNKPFFAFGTSMLNEKEKHRALSYVNGIYQLIEDDYAICFDGSHVTAFSDLKTNRKTSGKEMQDKKRMMERTLKAIIQTYNHCLISNSTSIHKK